MAKSNKQIVDESFLERKRDKAASKDAADTVPSNKWRWKTIYVMYFTMFIQSISYSIVMSSLWPFLRKIDGNIDETFLGWTNSGYCLAQLIFSVLFGYWCVYRPSIEPLFFSIVLLAAGNGLYAYAEVFGKKGTWIVFGSRVLSGIAGGVIAVSRTVVSQLSTEDELTKTLSHLTMYQDLGFFIGPVLQVAAKPLGSEGLYVSALKLYFNIYTAPCFFMILLAIINLFLLVKFFKGDDGRIRKSKSQDKKRSVDNEPAPSILPVDNLAIGVMLVLFFVNMSEFALIETTLSPMLMNLYAWSREETVFYGGILLSGTGVLGVVTYLFIPCLTRRLSNQALLTLGSILSMLAFVLFIPWGPGYLKITMADLRFPNETIIHSTKDVGGGCPYNYPWCYYTPRLPFPQFLTCVVIDVIGFALVTVLISIMYSKIIGPFPKGAYMGWLSGVGSLARIVGPLYATIIYSKLGIRWMAGGTAFLLGSTVIIILTTWQRIIPYSERQSPTPAADT